MINERQRLQLATKCSYRKIQRLFLWSLVASLAAAAASLYGAAQYHGASFRDDLLTTALVTLALAMIPLGVIVFLALRRIVRSDPPPSTDNGDASPAQQRLDQQQRVWRHLRELHQQNVPEPRFLAAVLESLKALLGTPRISIWFFDDAGQTLTCRCSLPASPIDDRLERQKLNHYFDTLHRMPYVAANHAFEDTRLGGLEDYLDKHGIAALLDVGIFVGGELRGVLCCGDSQPRDWQPDEINTVMGVSGLLSQFAESLRRREIEDDLDQQIHFDTITGLPNLRGLTRAIDRQGAALSAYHLVVVRIGGLRQVNQQFGQEAGNQTLGEVASALRKRLMPQRRAPRLARLPGNYLAILLPGDSPDAWLLQRLEETLTALTETPWLSADHPCQLHFLAGVAHYPRDGHSLDEVLQAAELALKQTRQQDQRLLLEYMPELSEWAAQRLRIEQELRTALAQQQFRIVLQPQFTDQGTLYGAELLLRWQHPERGLLAPGYFIGDAERCNLMRPIGDWVLDQAASLLSGPLADTDLTLSVNVSIQQLADSAFAARIEGVVASNGFAPQRLVLEIVESLLATPELAATLQQLRQLGVQLAIDDFGTGYSSLRYLQEFPLNEIKLDKTFIDPLQHSDDAPLARSIIALAQTMKLRLVAEGIETESQLIFLRRHGVSRLQGYYLARPEAPEAFLARLKRLAEEA
ncbi:GGDEF and EAL domain-containing protein [Halomonas sp. HP20-15]|uniref:putative bifunctional diguanylate cyclase/phosphodiesterase n=1 Tax=Halomonas sp. HP20-15 TaxID=3085901 RepID=UPI002982323F|nr:GGDEF and EAL domain-containing protein [Halomonas sp. HP20-15]MDW5375722.1 GGDEF and EAL domain-containing protein [Halomonas sp. HP20-15]